VLNKLIDNYEISWFRKPLFVKDKEFEAGTGIISGNVDIETLNTIAKDLKVNFYGVDKIENREVLKLKRPRLGLFKGWLGSMDEGWTRFVLENYNFKYESLFNERIKEGNLIKDFDVIIIPDVGMNSVIDGLSVERVPEKYAGGIGEKGVENLKQFVEQGGTLITLDSASELPIKKFWIGVKNSVEELKSTEFFVPGSILRIIVDNKHPIGYGMPREASAFFAFSPVFSLYEGKAVAKYPSHDPLLSGFVLGTKHLVNKTALAEIPLGKGKIILIGFRVQNRAQILNTFKLLFNSIFYGASSPEKLSAIIPGK